MEATTAILFPTRKENRQIDLLKKATLSAYMIELVVNEYCTLVLVVI